MELFRGTQSDKVEGYHPTQSWTPSLPVAVIWSSRPGSVWDRREAAFLPTSTVHVGSLKAKKVLELGDQCAMSFSRLLEVLRYGKKDGIKHKEALDVLWYMHRRLIGKVPGGEFLYRVLDEDGEEMDGQDIPLSFSDPETLISQFREEFEYRQDAEFGDFLEADTFIFADAPRVQEVARRLGYQALMYIDVFAGGSYVSEKLIGIPVDDMKGVLMDQDLQGEEVPTHETYRPLVREAVEQEASILTSELLKAIPPGELRRT